MVKSQKGGTFERKISKLLSLWWTNGERDDVYWRSQTSGARATTRAKVGKETFGQYGDIQATDPIGQPLMDKCVIELKNGYKKWSFMDVLDKTEKSALQQFEKFLQQVLGDQEKAGTPYFILITKRDQRVPINTIPLKLYLDIRAHFGDPSFEYCPMLMRMRYLDHPLISLRSKDFFNWCQPSFFKPHKRRERL